MIGGTQGKERMTLVERQQFRDLAFTAKSVVKVFLGQQELAKGIGGGEANNITSLDLRL